MSTLRTIIQPCLSLCLWGAVAAIASSGCDNEPETSGAKASDSKTQKNEKTGKEDEDSVESKRVCGGPSKKGCDDDKLSYFCSYSLEAKCGEDGAPGTCEIVPESCSDPYDPVCGCDGRTYGNACSASLDFVAVASKGPCDPEPGEAEGDCGGKDEVPCKEGEYCAYPDKAQCGASGEMGTCKPLIELGCNSVYSPVCGCDGETHGNKCYAASSGTSVAYFGECADKPKSSKG